MRLAFAFTCAGASNLALRIGAPPVSGVSGFWRFVGSSRRFARWADSEGSSQRFNTGTFPRPSSGVGNGVDYVWNESDGSLIVRRSPHPTLPIYYWVGRDTIEIDHDLDRLAHTVGPVRFDRTSLLHFVWRGRPAPGRSLYSSINSLALGEELVLFPGRRPTVRRKWWALHPKKVPWGNQAPFKTALTRIEASVLHDATATTADGDSSGRGGPALLLSGGVDSSLIAALARRAGVPLTAFTVAFNDKFRINETNFASRVSRFLRMPHQLVRIGIEDAKRLLGQVLDQSPPVAAAAGITNTALMEAAVGRGHYRVFSGLGADECFGGYHKPLEYLAAQNHHMRRLGFDLQDLYDASFARLSRLRHAIFFGVAEFFQYSELSQVAVDHKLVRDFPAMDVTFYRGALSVKPFAHALEMMAVHEYHHRVSELLIPSFRPHKLNESASIAYPYLNPAVYSWASALGPELCYWHERGAWWAKRLLRVAAATCLPHDIVMRKRQVFFAPLAYWLLNRGFRTTISEEIADSEFWKLGVVRAEVRHKILRKLRRYKHLDAANAWQEKLWVVLVLCAWINRREAVLRFGRVRDGC